MGADTSTVAGAVGAAVEAGAEAGAGGCAALPLVAVEGADVIPRAAAAGGTTLATAGAGLALGAAAARAFVQLARLDA
jgi:hypothetical protein